MKFLKHIFLYRGYITDVVLMDRAIKVKKLDPSKADELEILYQEITEFSFKRSDKSLDNYLFAFQTRNERFFLRHKLVAQGFIKSFLLKIGEDKIEIIKKNILKKRCILILIKFFLMFTFFSLNKNVSFLKLLGQFLFLGIAIDFYYFFLEKKMFKEIKDFSKINNLS